MPGKPGSSKEKIALCHQIALNLDNECILWPFRIDGHGYTTFSVGKVNKRPHRIICELAHGPSPEGKPFVAHACRHRHCVAPAHLRWASPAENSADMIRDGTSLKGEYNPTAILTDQEVVEIRVKLDSKEFTPKDLAIAYGVETSTIRKIRTGKLRPSVGGPIGVPESCVGEANHLSKLTEAAVIDIRYAYENKLATARQLAEKYSVDPTLIWLVAKRKIWKHVP